MTNTEINFVTQCLNDIIELRHKLSEQERLTDAEKHKTSTAFGLNQQHISEVFQIRKKLTALCRCVNRLAIADDWKKESPKKCKEFLISFKMSIADCIEKYDIHFNADGDAS